jgi:hypothetical protein
MDARSHATDFTEPAQLAADTGLLDGQTTHQKIARRSGEQRLQ